MKSNSIISEIAAAFLIFAGFILCFSVKAEAQNRKIDVWDFGYEFQAGEYYDNHINRETLYAGLDEYGITGGEVPYKLELSKMNFGDLNLFIIDRDRFYNSGSNTYGSPGKKYSDDLYTSNGYYYGNGTGGEKRRFVVIENVKAGDVINAYAGWTNTPSGDGDTLTFVSGALNGSSFTPDGVQEDISEPFKTASKISFIAKADSSYKIYTDSANGGKPIYFRYERIPAVTVCGTITGELPLSFGIKFKNEVTGDEITAGLSDGAYSAVLPTGYRYTAVMTDTSGYGFTIESKNIETRLSDAETGIVEANLVSEVKTPYVLSGKIEGIDSDYEADSIALTFEPQDNPAVKPVKADVNIHDFTFSAELEPGVTYTVTMTGLGDYRIAEGKSVFFDGTDKAEQNIRVERKETYAVSGKFIGLTDTRGVYADLDISPKAVTFKNEEDGYVYSGNIEQGKYSANLRDGAYLAQIEDEYYRTTSHVIVSGGAVIRDLLCEYIGPEKSAEYVSDIYVGENREYKTVQSALRAVGAMGVRSENERVTIHIDPGVYREQVVIDEPYITLINDSKEKEVVISWYYGAGYEYYSCDGRFYNPYSEYDRYKKGTAGEKSAALYIKEEAEQFKAENICFESSFNRYMTDEEIEDGVSPTDEKLPKRTISTDVADGEAMRSSLAAAIESNNNEFYRCSFAGVCNTLYTGNKNYSNYFKNCKITGQNDYIFGGSNCVFDGCELQWSGFSANARSGYITAADGNAEHGYLFRGCMITSASAYDDTVTSPAGGLGRAAGKNAKTVFADTKLEDESCIAAKKWDGEDNADFIEYNTMYNNERIASDTEELDRTRYSAEVYLNGFVPESFSQDLGAEPKFETAPYLTSNGDLNAPTIGNTFYVNYNMGDFKNTDVSAISWYRVDESGNRTLIKTTAAFISTAYQAMPEDAGCRLEAVIAPAALDGKFGKPITVITEHFLGANWVNPSNPNEPEPGKGINIFLAGDSTVKDYSSSGMYMGGKIENKGSWGEMLQYYFDSDYVTVLNYANGGRSIRSFLNEGSLAKIESNIKEGDYLLLQFGGNDAANQEAYLEDRYVPLDEPGIGTEDAVFPLSYPQEGFFGAKLNSDGTITKGNLTYDCGATYKWYLKQYVDMARSKGAIPILVTSVVRYVFDDNGKIKVHLDSVDTTTNTYVSQNNGYYRVFKQFAEEEDVLLIDLFDMTTNMLEQAYADDSEAEKSKSPYAEVIFCGTDGTHRSKTGGMLEAGEIAHVIQNMKLSISPFVKVPSSCEGVNTDGVMFTVSRSGVFSANDNNYNYSAYWSEYGQNLFEEIEADMNKQEPVPSTSTSIEDNGGRYIVRTELNNISDGCVYVAAYDADDALIGINTAAAAGGEVVSEFNSRLSPSIAYIKVFVWDDKQKPLTNAEYVRP